MNDFSFPPPSSPAGDLPTPLLVERFQAGTDREECFRRLFERHYRLVRSFFTRDGFSAEGSEDLAQEVFLSAYRGLDTFRGDAQFHTWLLRIAGNVRSRARRHTVRQRAMRAMHSLEPANPEEGAPDPLDALLDRERYRQVLDELHAMPSQMRQCVSLRLFQGLRYREIARALGVSLDSVRVQLARGRRRLRQALHPFQWAPFQLYGAPD